MSTPTVSPKIKGVALFLELGNPAAQYECDITALTITNDDAEEETQTFCEVDNDDARDFKMNFTAIQSTHSASFWSYIWEHTGDVVPFAYAPHGNDTPTEHQPHFTGTVKIGPKPTIGGEAGKTNTYTFENEWEIITGPLIDRGGEEEG